MNKPILAGIRCSLMLLLPAVAYPNSAQWDLDPISGDWNTAANWTPMGVPNGPSDIATFGLSNTTNVSISADTEVEGITFTSAATNPYTITASAGLVLTLSGIGITNNSGITQNFATALGGEIRFTNGAMAGSSGITNKGGTASGQSGGFTRFFDTSSAGSASITNKGAALSGSGRGITVFQDSSTAASASITNETGGGATLFEGGTNAGNAIIISNGETVTGTGSGETDFFGTLAANASAANATFINNGAAVSSAFFNGGGARFIFGSTAANATFINNGGIASGAGGGFADFYDGATAANATITNNGATVSGAGGGFTLFEGTQNSTSAGDSIITNNGGTVSGAGGGKTIFRGGIATADSATLIANGGTNGGEGGQILFFGDSTGGTSRVEVFGNGNLDISAHDASPDTGMVIGSIEGDGNVFLGANNLNVGSNDLNTNCFGVIQDGGQNGGIGGSLTKIGFGTLTLSGANTYTGDTHINRGVLNVDGSINSNTFVHHTSTLAGTGTVHGNVTNRGTVSPGDPVGTLTVSNYTQAQYAYLMIQIAGANAGQFGVLDVLGTANLSGHLDPVLLNGFVPTVGESFTFLNAGAVNGTLFIFNRNISNEPEHWEVSYFPTYAILTVASGNVPLPDGGSTFLLLTLGLLGLVGYQKARTMTPLIQLKKATSLFLIALAYFGLSPDIRAVSPPPDGGYPGANTAEGDNALFRLTTGVNNTAIGFQALDSLTTGEGNTALGSNALFSNTIGDNNTATGFQALLNNTNGTDNTATGVDALLRNTIGSQNTATGKDALLGNMAGTANTATGWLALTTNTSGGNNTAIGAAALAINTTGSNNTACGVSALGSTSGGRNNTATGAFALSSDTTGINNTATGQSCLWNNTTGGFNTANGFGALLNNTAGSSNIALGSNAGANLTTGSNNIDIGSRGVAGEAATIRIGSPGVNTAAYIAGIYNRTVANGVGVIINSNGQLGTLQSSARYKEAIKPMEHASEALLKLKPVTFRYKQELDPKHIPQFGLIAEDVEKVNPDLVVRDEEGKVISVRYEAVNAMLLNEFLKEHRKVEQQEATITQLKKDFGATIAQLTARLDEQASQIQKVSAQLEVNKTVPQMVFNNQ